MLIEIIIWSLGVSSILLTLLPILPCKQWWVRVWDFPRLQLCCFMLVPLAIIAADDYSSTPHLVLAGCLLAAMAYQLVFVAPFTPLWKCEAQKADNDDPQALSLLVVNVLMTNRRYEKLAEQIKHHNPDVVFALETDQWWVEKLSAMLPDHPYRMLHPLDNTYGLAFYSRYEIHNETLRFLLSKEVPSVRCTIRLPDGTDIEFFGVHPEPPSPTEAESSLGRDAELILVGKEAAPLECPAMVAGDLNDVAWSHTSRLFRRISGLLDPRIGRGMFSTFHAEHWFARWPLDHVFYSPHFQLKHMQRLEAFGSDHYPIYLQLAHVPHEQDEQEPEQADADDHDEAGETVQNARQESGT